MALRIFDSALHRESTAIDRVGRFSHTFGGSCEEFGIRVYTQSAPFRLFDDIVRKVLREPNVQLLRDPSHFLERIMHRPFIKMSRRHLGGCHLLFRLDLSDDSLGIKIPNLRFLPLAYGFHYASIWGEFTYRPVCDSVIDVIDPVRPIYAPNFPRKNFPSTFPKRPISFENRAIDVTNAEQALDFQGVFRLDHLSPSEMMRAIGIAKTNGIVKFDDPPDNNWDDETILVALGHSPFAQSSPSEFCTNPNCTVPLNIDLTERVKRPVRMKSRRVFAMYECEPGDGIDFGQIVFQYCSYCYEITVRNQCD